MTLELSNIGVSFGGGEFASDGVGFAVARGELVVLVGESGCGAIARSDRLVALMSRSCPSCRV